MSLAWCLKNPHVSTVITGASRPAQVIENMKALDVVGKLTPDVMARIDTGARRCRIRVVPAVSNPLESWNEEQRSALLYRVCAEAEAGTTRAELFRRLAGEAEAQAAIWRAQLTARGHPPPGPYVPDARTRLVATLVRRLGPRRLKGVLAAMKVRGMAIYGTSPPRDAGHATPVAGTGIEHRHRGLGGGGNLRAAVFGVNDGLVSNASLILGVAGASADAHVVLLTGVAGMCAGAFAMATGEYVSVRSQRELFEYQIGLERDELAQYPEAEAQELALIYAAKGLPAGGGRRASPRRSSPIPSTRSTRWRARSSASIPTSWARRGAPRFRRSFRSPPAPLLPLAPFVFGAGPARAAGGDRRHRGRAVRGRRDAVAVHRPQRVALRRAHAGAGRARGRRHVRDRPPRRCRAWLTRYPVAAA